MKFPRNLSNIDRIIRTLLGLVLIYYGFVDPSVIANPVAATLVGLFGLINIFAGITAFCPVYKLAGLSTCRKRSEDSTT